MHTDYAVLTGAQHTVTAVPCQDYCLAQARDDRGWALVADGCSTGAQTDLGARAWVLAARQYLRTQETIVTDAAVLQAALLAGAEPALAQLDFADGFATLGVLQLHGLRVHATFFGDGALLVRHQDGSLTLVNLQYTANAPAYLNYLRPPARQDQWEQEFPGQELIATTSRYSADGALVRLNTTVVPAGAGPWQWTAHTEQDELELVLLATDGVSSRNEGFIATARQLLDVKSPAGEFLHRRVGKLAREWSKTGSIPTDDLAVAGLWLGQEVPHG